MSDEYRIISKHHWTPIGYRLMYARQRVTAFNGAEMHWVVKPSDWIDAVFVTGEAK